MAGADDFLKIFQFATGMAGGFAKQAQQERQRNEREKLQLMRLLHAQGDQFDLVPSTDVDRPSSFFDRAFGTGEATRRSTGAPVFNVQGGSFARRPFAPTELNIDTLLPRDTKDVTPGATARTTTGAAAPGKQRLSPEEQRQFDNDPVLISLRSRLERTPRNPTEQAEHRAAFDKAAQRIAHLRAGNEEKRLAREKENRQREQKRQDVRFGRVTREAEAERAREERKAAAKRSTEERKAAAALAVEERKEAAKLERRFRKELQQDKNVASTSKSRTKSEENAVRQVISLRRAKAKLLDGGSGDLDDILMAKMFPDLDQDERNIITGNASSSDPEARDAAIKSIDAGIAFWMQKVPSGVFEEPSPPESDAPPDAELPTVRGSKITGVKVRRAK
jgi:hypothetical protein